MSAKGILPCTWTVVFFRQYRADILSPLCAGGHWWATQVAKHVSCEEDLWHLSSNHSRRQTGWWLVCYSLQSQLQTDPAIAGFATAIAKWKITFIRVLEEYFYSFRAVVTGRFQIWRWWTFINVQGIFQVDFWCADWSRSIATGLQTVWLVFCLSEKWRAADLSF